MFVYADNAATTRVLPKVLEAMLPYFTEQYGNPSSTYPLGHIPVTLKNGDIDFLSGSAHKFHGPKGVGFLFTKQGIALEILIFGGEQERGKRAGTENVPGIVGMAAALEESARNLDAHAEKMATARNTLEQQLLALPGTRVHSGQVPRLPGHLNMAFDGVPAEALLPVLGMAGICVSAGSACASGSPEPSHVLLALGCTPEEAKCSLRFSLGDDITREQVDWTAATVIREVQRLRKLEHRL